MSALGQKVPLGRTGLSVSRLGLGAAYGVSYRACRKAIDCGVNYLFWGSVRTRGMGAAIREVAPQRREDLVVVLECYARHPWMIRRSVENGLAALKLDYADVLLLGWYDEPPARRILDAVVALKEAQRYRFLGISSHRRALFGLYLSEGIYDVFHVRYNAAHPGAETEVFPALPATGRPGVVAFTCTRWGDLLQASHMPPGLSAPSARDCYRFALSHPKVDVAICGPKNDGELDHALAVLESDAMSPGELDTMRRVGTHVHGVRSFMSVLS